MRFTHGMEDWGQEHPLSHKKINSSSACDHWPRFGCRIVLAEASSLSFTGTAFFSESAETCCSGNRGHLRVGWSSSPLMVVAGRTPAAWLCSHWLRVDKFC